MLRTLGMRDTQFLDKTWRKDSGSKCSSEDCGEFIVETTDSHIFELEVWRDDRGRRRPAISRMIKQEGDQIMNQHQCEGFYASALPVAGILQLDGASGIFKPLDLCAFHDNTHRIAIHSL